MSPLEKATILISVLTIVSNVLLFFYKRGS